MTIIKPRYNNRRRRGFGRRRAPRREHMRTQAEQLDYEMELLRAQREGREEEFRTGERAKLRAQRLTQLDDEMDDYFRKRDENAEHGSAQTTQEEATQPSKTFDVDEHRPRKSQQQSKSAESTATS